MKTAILGFFGWAVCCIADAANLPELSLCAVGLCILGGCVGCRK